MHDEAELLHELRRLLSAFEKAEVGEVERGEPVHEPELEHEAAADLFVDLGVELPLTLFTQAISLSHLGEVKPILHVLEWTLNQRIDCGE